jgi:hypothetical protein
MDWCVDPPQMSPLQIKLPPFLSAQFQLKGILQKYINTLVKIMAELDVSLVLMNKIQRYPITEIKCVQMGIQ